MLHYERATNEIIAEYKKETQRFLWSYQALN